MRSCSVLWGCATVGLLTWASWSLFISFFAQDCADADCYSGCHPLASSKAACLLPFPSTFWEDRPSGKGQARGQLRIPESALPRLRSGPHLDIQGLLELYDGWSPVTAVLFELPGLRDALGQDDLPKPTHFMVGTNHLNESVLPHSATLILRASNSEAVPHHSEEDMMSQPIDVGILQPAMPLIPGERYVVVVQNLTEATAGPLAAPAAFAKLWADARAISSTAPASEELASYYARSVLPVVQRSKLVASLDAVQLCWDFTVRSAGSFGGVQVTRAAADWIRSPGDSPWNTSFKLHHTEVRDCSAAVERAKGTPYDYLSELADENLQVKNTYGLVLQGRMTVPRLLHDKARDSGFRAEVTNSIRTQTPIKPSHFQSMFGQRPLDEVPVWIGVPCELLANRSQRAIDSILVVGHGLFTSKNEANDEHFPRTAANLGAIVLATDFRGFSKYDQPVVLRALLSKPELLYSTTANLLQGHLSNAALVAWAQGQTAGTSLNSTLQEHDTSQHLAMVQNPRVLFYGISAGGILGSGLVSSFVPFERAVLGSPGVPFTFLLPRSNNFFLYEKVLLSTLFTTTHLRVTLSLAQLFFDEVTAVGLAADVNHGASLTPQVLLQTGLGDANVPRLGAEILAHTLGTCGAFPSMWSVNPFGEGALYGLAKVSSGDADKGYGCWLTEVEYLEEQEEMPETNIFPPSSHVHFCVRRDPYVMLQNTQFLKDGHIVDVCVADHCVRKDASQSCEQQL